MYVARPNCSESVRHQRRNPLEEVFEFTAVNDQDVHLCVDLVRSVNDGFVKQKGPVCAVGEVVATFDI